MQVAELLDRAKLRTGSDGATARAVGVSAQRISDWRHKRQPIPARIVLQIGELAEFTPEDMVRAMKAVARCETKGQLALRL
jgi:DNA-binding transcriptional regulator YdaS (Cro superfamily)